MALRLVQVGLGSWGRDWYGSVLRRHPGVKVVGLVDSDERALAQVRAEYDIEPARCFATIEDALHEARADAAVVTASLPGHAPLCRAALAARLHVLVEKAFVATVAEARALATSAGRHRRVPDGEPELQMATGRAGRPEGPPQRTTRRGRHGGDRLPPPRQRPAARAPSLQDRSRSCSIWPCTRWISC